MIYCSIKFRPDTITKKQVHIRTKELLHRVAESTHELAIDELYCRGSRFSRSNELLSYYAN